MSNWIRREELEQQVEDTYGIKLVVYFKSAGRDAYEVKLVNGLKEAVLKEIMKKGLTVNVLLDFDGITSTFKSYVEAERAAIEKLR